MEIREYPPVVESIHAEAQRRGVFSQLAEDERLQGRSVCRGGRDLVTFSSYAGLKDSPALLASPGGESGALMEDPASGGPADELPVAWYAANGSAGDYAWLFRGLRPTCAYIRMPSHDTEGRLDEILAEVGLGASA